MASTAALETAFVAAERTGMLSDKQYMDIAATLTVLLDGIKTSQVRAVLHPRPTAYPGYVMTQEGMKEEAVTTSHNRPNSIKEVADSVIPIRLYDSISASLIAGLADEFIHIGNTELMFLMSDHAISDPTGLSEDSIYSAISMNHISSLLVAAMQLENAAKARTEDFFEAHNKAADIKVTFYAINKLVNPSTDVLVVFDFAVL